MTLMTLWYFADASMNGHFDSALCKFRGACPACSSGHAHSCERQKFWDFTGADLQPLRRCEHSESA